MNKYELIYVIDTAMEESARNELIARFSVVWPTPSTTRTRATTSW